MHAHNKGDAAGTALAIAYVVSLIPASLFVLDAVLNHSHFTKQDDISKVTPENLVVFTVRYKFRT